jgi:endonuclease/exonuclease/phosphatase family metal-dependent hydrolase
MAFHMSHAVIPPARHLSIKKPLNFFRHGGSSPNQSGSNSSDEDDETSPGRYSTSLSSAQAAATSEELPDASRANRRPPDYPVPISIPAKTHVHCQAVHRNKIVVGHHKELRIYTVGTESIEESTCHLSTEYENIKLSALAFKPVAPLSDGTRLKREEGRYLWFGTKEGSMMEFDMLASAVIYCKINVHTAPIILLERCGSKMISLDESGKIGIWQDKGHGLSLRESPITQRITMDKTACAFMVGTQLWVASNAQETTSSTSKAASSSPKLRMYQPFDDDKPFNAVSRPCSISEAMGGEVVGQITCGAVLPARKDVVFVGHINGFISIWSRTTYSCIAVQRVAVSITSLAGVGHIRKYLWAGDKLGKIKVFDVSCNPWLVVKEWDAHDSAVTHLSVDTTSLAESKLPVLSTSMEGQVHIWDGLLTSDWLLQRLEEHEAEYSSYRSLQIRMFSYNVDGNPPDAFADSGFPDMAKVFSEGEPPDLIVFGLQELVELDDTKIVAKTFLFGGAGRRGKGQGTEGKGSEVSDRISHQYRTWLQHFSEEIRKNAPVTYTMVLTDNLVGLFTAIFVRDRELGNVKDPRIVSVKTGFGGRMGNKGALAASLTIDDASIALVNCHLAAGQRKVRHRNADLVDILDTAMYKSRSGQLSEAFAGGGDGSMILDHQVVILSGDLNFRIELSRDHCVELISKSDHKALLAKDQLHREMRQNPAFRLRHFVEAPIEFLPTYKYKQYTDEWDPSEKRRVPSYCDRILWHCRKEETVQCAEYDRLEYTPSDHRPITARLMIKVRRSDQEKRAAIVKELQEYWPHLRAEAMTAAAEYYQ